MTDLIEMLSFICHQNSERSFLFLNNKALLCSRCSGLYSGFIIMGLGGLKISMLNTFIMNYSFFTVACCFSLVCVSVTELDSNPIRFFLGLATGISMGNIFNLGFKKNQSKTRREK